MTIRYRPGPAAATTVPHRSRRFPSPESKAASRWPACGCSTCRAWWPAGSPACSSPTSAPTWSRSSSRAAATRCANGPPAASRIWWKVYARNKRLITLNLKAPEGRALLQQLVPRFDVMIESFVPGTLERMGLGWDVLSSLAPRVDPPADFRLGAGRAWQRAAGIRHARRGGERLCRDERRAGRPADRAELSARRHDLGSVCLQRHHVRALSPRQQRRRRAGHRRLAVRVAVLAARSAAGGIRGARARAHPRGKPVEERRSARLLSHARRSAGLPSAVRRRRWPSASCAAMGSMRCSTDPAFRDQRGACAARARSRPR